jgi:DNA-binding transcriptional regulator YiaG
VDKEYLLTKDVIKSYRSKMNITQGELAAYLVKGVLNKKLSRQAVSNWELGNDEPDVVFLLLCTVIYKDWRRQFVADCLCAMLPEVFKRFNGRLVFLG